MSSNGFMYFPVELRGSTFYYEGVGRSFEQTRNFDEIIGIQVKRLVIELYSIFYISGITATAKEGEPDTLSFSLSSGYVKSDCQESHIGPESERNYNCSKLTRFILFSGNTVFKSLKALGYDTKLDNYLGCFVARHIPQGVQRLSMEECTNRCSDFFGLRSPNDCLCVANLTELIPMALQLCSASKDEQKLHGGGHFFVMYSKNLLKKNHQPVALSWNCIWSAIDCPTCVYGRIGQRCEDIDCSKNNGNCGEMECQIMASAGMDVFKVAICACKQGYVSDNSLNCIDFDECLDQHKCIEDVFCHNLPGNYLCLCSHGFYNVDYKTCADVDECTSSEACDSNSTNCVNIEGSYSCQCKEGFVKTAGIFTTCQDVDECEPNNNQCPQLAVCINLPGTYDCICPENTEKKKYLYSIECEDIDECLNDDSCNNTISVCLNVPTSYMCVCRYEYVNVDNLTCVYRKEDARIPESYNFSSTILYDYEESGEFDLISALYTFFFLLFILILFICLVSNFRVSSSFSTSSVSRESA